MEKICTEVELLVSGAVNRVLLDKKERWLSSAPLISQKCKFVFVSWALHRSQYLPFIPFDYHPQLRSRFYILLSGLTSESLVSFRFVPLLAFIHLIYTRLSLPIPYVYDPAHNDPKRVFLQFLVDQISFCD
jgi:hypothetical protein